MKNVPIRVCENRIGGYQVIKKWLSYRDLELLGRSFFMDEASYVAVKGGDVCAAENR